MTVHDEPMNTLTAHADLPAVIRTYLDAHRLGDVRTAASTFAPDAEVTDEGRTHRGRDEITAWLSRAGREYTYTTEFIHAVVSGPSEADVLQHLEGDFPGGVADLHFWFTLDGELIGRLRIEP